MRLVNASASVQSASKPRHCSSSKILMARRVARRRAFSKRAAGGPCLIQSHARFHLAIGERNLVHDQFQVPDAVRLNEEHFLLQPQSTAQPDAAVQPDFNPMAQRQIHAPGQLRDCHAAAGKPLGVALRGPGGPKTEFALFFHAILSPEGRLAPTDPALLDGYACPGPLYAAT